MDRRLAYEPEQLVERLTSWMNWRYADSPTPLLLTSAPTLPPPLLRGWMQARQGTVWRLAWLGNGAAVLCGIAVRAPAGTAPNYSIVQHDGVNQWTEGVFECLPDGQWRQVDGDGG